MTIIAFNRQWVVRWHWLIVNLVVIVILLSLSFWQWQRATQKQQSLHILSQWQSQQALSLAELVSNESSGIFPGNNLATRDGASVNFPAHWLAPYVWLLDNQIIKGQPGYDVLIPVQENVPASSSINSHTGRPIVLVNLGWVAAPAQRTELPAIEISENLTVQGIYRAQAGNFLLGKNLEDLGQWPMRIQQPDNQLLAAYLPAPLTDGIIYQQQGSSFVIHYRPVVLPPERHKAYALQWLLLAIAASLIGLACAKAADEPHFAEKSL
ncbi:MAG: hypothetical protein B0W54_10875 [Cellvibrio sp. 79]|nr:MAG: hypothetical protein B0W54_10875 [Cellvibrio sp. 79]